MKLFLLGFLLLPSVVLATVPKHVLWNTTHGVLEVLDEKGEARFVSFPGQRKPDSVPASGWRLEPDDFLLGSRLDGKPERLFVRNAGKVFSVERSGARTLLGEGKLTRETVASLTAVDVDEDDGLFLYDEASRLTFLAPGQEPILIATFSRNASTNPGALRQRASYVVRFRASYEPLRLLTWIPEAGGLPWRNVSPVSVVIHDLWLPDPDETKAHLQVYSLSEIYPRPPNGAEPHWDSPAAEHTGGLVRVAASVPVEPLREAGLYPRCRDLLPADE